MGVIMILVGLAIARTGTRVLNIESGVGHHVYESPSIFHPFWVPLSYDVIHTPDYSFKFLAFGTCLATTGFWVVYSAIKEKSGQ
jgi:hypothetical protein